MSQLLFTTLRGLKNRAKAVKKGEGITHTEALELVARQAGYANYLHALRELEA